MAELDPRDPRARFLWADGDIEIDPIEVEPGEEAPSSEQSEDGRSGANEDGPDA